MYFCFVDRFVGCSGICVPGSASGFPNPPRVADWHLLLGVAERPGMVLVVRERGSVGPAIKAVIGTTPVAA